MKKIPVFAGAFLLSASMYAFADFTIGVNGDTQNLSESDRGGDLIKAMNQFYVDRKEELNMKFVISVGDMTQDGGPGSSQWKRVTEAYGVLTEAGIPFAPCQGNHDELDAINDAFPVSDFENTPTWGGSYDGGIENAWYKFEAEEMKFMVLVKGMRNNSGVNEWANGVFEQNSDRRGMFFSHHQMTELIGETLNIEEIVSKHDNIFLANQGHQCETGGEEYWTRQSPGGFTQNILRSDYQCRSNDGAFVRYYTFKPDEDQICAFTYNISEEAYEQDDNSEFCFEYDMEPAPVSTAPSTPAATGAPGYDIISGNLDAASYGDVKAVTVYDIAGKLRFHRELNGSGTGVDLSDFEQGRYFVQFTTASGSVNKPVLLFR